MIQVRLALSLLFSFLSLDVLLSFILSRAMVTCSASSSELDTVQEKYETLKEIAFDSFAASFSFSPTLTPLSQLAGESG